MGENEALKDFDEQIAHDLWEDAISLADQLIPIVFAASKNTTVEKNSPNQDLSAVIIRRTLALMLISCFMNRNTLETNTLDDAFAACKRVAKEVFNQYDTKVSIIQ
jgi:hypothetical protein